MVIAPPRAGRLRDGNQGYAGLVSATGAPSDDGGFAVCRDIGSVFAFAHESASHVSPWHAQPAWTILLPRDATTIAIGYDGGHRRFRTAVALAPSFCHWSAFDGPYVAVFVDPLVVQSDSGRPMEPLSPALTSRLVAGFGVERLDRDRDIDVTGGAGQLHHALGPLDSLDPRMKLVAEIILDVPHLRDVAARVDLSPSHLRTLVEKYARVSLRELRAWRRLTQALTLMQTTPTGMAAVAAGFADQPHLTRVTRRLTGRTPGDIAHDLRVN
jgi:AraC-like DNA-binding protein